MYLGGLFRESGLTMEIFNIGPLEILFILILALLILGPKGMVDNARKLGIWIRKIIQSPLWHTVVSTSNEIRNIPRRIMDDTGIEKSVQEISKNFTNLSSEVSTSVRSISDDVKKITPSENIVPKEFESEKGDNLEKPNQQSS